MGELVKLEKKIDVRPLPNNLEAEQALLGAILLHDGVYGTVSDVIETKHFYEKVHQEIFDAIAFLYSQNRAVSPVTIKSYIAEIDLGPNVSAAGYLAQLMHDAVSIRAARDYALVIRDLWVKREIVIVCDAMRERAMLTGGREEPAMMIDEAVEGLIKLQPAQSDGSGEFTSFAHAAQMASDHAESAYKGGAALVGLSTGIDGLDDAMGGLAKSDLIVVGARPGMGKTALVTNIAFNVGKYLNEVRRQGLKTGVVAFFSLEMSSPQLALRVLSEHADVPSWLVRRGKVSEGQVTKVVEAAADLRNLPIWINSKSGISIGNLVAKARNLKRRMGVELIIVDYLQLIRMSGGRKDGNRSLELGEVTGALKGLAKDLDVPVIALSQLSRQIESRDDKRPLLSDLRESGSIEQDADQVLFIYREVYYLKGKEPKPGTDEHLKWQESMEAAMDRADIIIAKNRHGPAKTVELGYDEKITRFHDHAPETFLPNGLGSPDRKKKERFPAQAEWCLNALRGLTIASSVQNNGKMGKIPSKAKPVPYVLWRQTCAEGMLDTSTSEKDIKSFMEGVVRALSTPKGNLNPAIARHVFDDVAYVYLTDF